MVYDATILPWLFKVITNINMASDFHRHLYTLNWLSSFMAMGHTCICIVVGNITMILVLKSGKWKDHSLKVLETTDVDSGSHFMYFVTVGWMVSQSMQKEHLHFPQVSPNTPRAQSLRVMLNQYGLRKTDNKEHQSWKRVWLRYLQKWRLRQLLAVMSLLRFSNLLQRKRCNVSDRLLY